MLRRVPAVKKTSYNTRAYCPLLMAAFRNFENVYLSSHFLTEKYWQYFYVQPLCIMPTLPLKARFHSTACSLRSQRSIVLRIIIAQYIWSSTNKMCLLGSWTQLRCFGQTNQIHRRQTSFPGKNWNWWNCFCGN